MANVSTSTAARGQCRAFRADRRGAAALEFGLVAVPFLTFLLFLAELGYNFFAQASLDYAVQTAARQVQIGTVQGGATNAIFKASYLCPALKNLLPCGSVTVDVIPVDTDYYAELTGQLPVGTNGKLIVSTNSYCPGTPRQLMFVQAVYTSPSIIGLLLPSMTASSAAGRVHVTLATTGFINENFPITAAIPAGC